METRTAVKDSDEFYHCLHQKLRRYSIDEHLYEIQVKYYTRVRKGARKITIQTAMSTTLPHNPKAPASKHTSHTPSAITITYNWRKVRLESDFLQNHRPWQARFKWSSESEYLAVTMTRNKTITHKYLSVSQQDQQNSRNLLGRCSSLPMTRTHIRRSWISLQKRTAISQGKWKTAEACPSLEHTSMVSVFLCKITRYFSRKARQHLRKFPGQLYLAFCWCTHLLFLMAVFINRQDTVTRELQDISTGSAAQHTLSCMWPPTKNIFFANS